MGRYDNRRIVRNQELSYADMLQKRGVSYIDQYDTAVVNRIVVNKYLPIDRVQHVWTQGDRLWKLADKYYADSTYWWLIAWYNGKPTENHFQLGENINVPVPLDRVLAMYNGFL
jgi:nucleoid-associated protein YgaU